MRTSHCVSIPIFWNNIDGRFETFYKSFELDNKHYVFASINSFKLIAYLKKNYLGESEYLLGGKEGYYLIYILNNLVYDLSKKDKELSEIWKLVGFINPFMFEVITINEPMRRIINIGEHFENLMKKTLRTKFNFFKKFSNFKNKENKNNIICNLPQEIIDKIGNYCGVDE